MKISIFIKIEKITLNDLKEQLLFGHVFILPFWYQWNLFFITIFFILIILLFRNKYNLVLILICITSFIYQYNGKNKKFLKNIKGIQD